ncbi:hypothetical protein AB0D08_40045 [Kitasatospora sp. NPDC048540]|uniref:hypothetical protein n=1 Tax=unclassified Kitasatospora TaxID=2633591 RepID=UPI00053B5023|nr:hypothetical protein [Kitasatospora sp. MBT63]
MTGHTVSETPSAGRAYAHAPDLEEESTRVARILASQDLLNGAAVRQREVLLRQAAVDDRRWWQGRQERLLAVARVSAQSLLWFDLAFPQYAVGPHGPDAARWRIGPDGARAYLHQEYLAWLTGTRAAAQGGPGSGDPGVFPGGASPDRAVRTVHGSESVTGS